MASAPFETTLLRERFVIRDQSGKADKIVALSNRMVVSFKNTKNEIIESFTIRAHTMGLCTRIAAEICQTYESLGPIINRTSPFKWEKCWDMVLDEYEKKYNDNAWCAIYNEGKKVFSSNNYHIFLDLIEQFEGKNLGKYEQSLQLAEGALNKAGQNVKIEYDSNIALIMKQDGLQARVGIILRNPKKTTTFNFNVKEESADLPIQASHCLRVSSQFLDGIQLSFILGALTAKLGTGLSENRAADERQTRDARRKVNMSDATITTFTNNYLVTFRPERPDFSLLIDDAEKETRKAIQKKLDEQENDNNETVETTSV